MNLKETVARANQKKQDALDMDQAAFIAKYDSNAVEYRAALSMTKLAGLKPSPVEDQLIFDELNEACKPVAAFEFEGVIFKGSHYKAIAEYIAKKPSAKFFIWLQDNYKQLS